MLNCLIIYSPTAILLHLASDDLAKAMKYYRSGLGKFSMGWFGYARRQSDTEFFTNARLKV